MTSGQEAQLGPHLFYFAHLCGLLADSDSKQPMLKYTYVRRLLHLVYFYFFRKRELAHGAIILLKVRAFLYIILVPGEHQRAFSCACLLRLHIS